ncbi:MAG: 3-hydroxyisobutyryl-CoA hydrolase [Pseudomonadota bacterium]
MSDVLIRKSGRAGRITLNRPDALNALSWQMCLDIEEALDAWRMDDDVLVVVVDATGDKAFCAGGDLVEMHVQGTAGNLDYGRRFWTDEYRLNVKIAEYSKPFVTFLQGFTMGGGVGVGCHGSHRIVGDSSRIAMPEAAIGLMPDVGGTLLLANGPGRLGEYLGTTGFRMGPADAILATFADTYIPEVKWLGLIAELENTGDSACLQGETPPDGKLSAMQSWIDTAFQGATLGDAMRGFDDNDTKALLARQAPLAASCAYEAVNRARGLDTVRNAVAMEYRYSHRAVEQGDFIEGIRALIIDKDKSPRWQHACIEDVTAGDVARMLMPLGADALSLEETAI